MANIRPKDTDALSTLASNHEILVDGPDGFGTLLRDTFISQVAALIVANPTIYKIATLDGADKLTSSQDPSQPLSYKGTHNVSTNSPALADGSGTAGDTYQVNVAGTRNYGSGSLTLAVGDALVYNGSIWQQVSGVANILDGISTPAAAQTALEVISEDESAEIAGTKLVGPALYFDGSNDYLEVADDAKFSFTDGTDDLPFSISGWVKMEDATNFTVASKFNTGTGTEFIFRFNDSDKLTLLLYTDASNAWDFIADVASTSYEGQWIHVAATFGGAGPNSSNAFSSATASLYINGQLISSTDTQTGTYAGLSDTAHPVWIGRYQSTYTKGHIKEVKIFNRELTATEVAQLAKGNDLGFADEYGDHTTEKLTDGGMETWASGTDLTYWGEGSAVSVAQEAVDIQSGTYSCELTGGGAISPSSNNWLALNCGITSGKRYRFAGKFKRVSGSTDSLEIGVRYWPFVTFNGTTFTVNTDATYMPESRIVNQASLGGGWYSVTVEFVTFAGGLNELVFGVTGATDPYLIDDCSLVQVGTLADFRAEDFNESAGKLLDRSSNNFVGVNNGAILVGKRRHISADTIDLKNLPTSSAGLSAGEVWSNSGVLTIV